MSACEHPNGRVRYGVTEQPREVKGKPEWWAEVYGFCCDCGEVPYRRWLHKIKAAPTTKG